MSSYIRVLAPDNLLYLIGTETQAGRRPALAEGWLKLFELQARYLAEAPTQERLGTIVPENFRTDTLFREVSWGIIQNPRLTAHGGMRGDHVLNGGLIRHADDLSWRIHT